MKTKNILDDRYTVYENGEIKSNRRNKLLVKSINNGYFKVALWDGVKYIHKRVHTIMAETFIDNYENKRTVNYIDGDKLNNNLSNLEWATDSENITHAYKLGLNVKKRKLTDNDITKIINCKRSLTTLTKSLGISSGHARSIRKGKYIQQYIHTGGKTPKVEHNRNINNTSGYTGVTLEKGKWKAIIYCHGKRKIIGTFNEKQNAIDARKQADVAKLTKCLCT